MPNVYPAGRSAQQTASTTDTPGRQAPKMARSAGAPTIALPWATRPSAVSRTQRRNAVPIGHSARFSPKCFSAPYSAACAFSAHTFLCSTPLLAIIVVHPVSSFQPASCSSTCPDDHSQTCGGIDRLNEFSFQCSGGVNYYSCSGKAASGRSFSSLFSSRAPGRRPFTP